MKKFYLFLLFFLSIFNVNSGKLEDFETDETLNSLAIPGYNAYASGESGVQVVRSAGSDIMLTIAGGKLVKVAWNGSKALYQGAKALGRELSAMNKVQVIEREIVRPLLPGEGNVGTYRELKAMNQKEGLDGLAAHHMPSSAYMKKQGVDKMDAIVMNVEHPLQKTIPQGRHQQTRTFGGKARVDSGLAPRDELAADIHDMRRIYQQQGLYTDKMKDSLLGVIKQDQAKFPEIFGKAEKK